MLSVLYFIFTIMFYMTRQTKLYYICIYILKNKYIQFVTHILTSLLSNMNHNNLESDSNLYEYIVATSLYNIISTSTYMLCKVVICYKVGRELIDGQG
jgi:hypothetical protein